MPFLFRLPLFLFDIEDPETLEKHRDSILAAIKLSSSVFYGELKGKSFFELDEKLRVKLRKYLLRGRFRPTPFGMFSGVGLAHWGNELKTDFPIQAEELKDSKETNQTLQSDKSLNPLKSYYNLVPGIHQKHGFFQALVLDSQTHRWTGCKLPKNRLFETLIKNASDKPINFQEFHLLLNPNESSISKEQSKRVWDQIIDSRFLTPESDSKHARKGVDMILKNQPEIPEKISIQLQQFIDSAGSLFSKEESTYLQDFKNWFTLQFDDRYVSLNDLLPQGEFFSGSFHYQDHSEKSETDIATIVLSESGKKTVDLDKHFYKAELSPEINDIQILYRLDNNLNPVIENIVCNRPFVYTGRFNRDPDIESYSKTTRDQIYTDDNTIYAHLKIRETEAINHICDVTTVFNYEITPFTPNSTQQLDFRDLYIGIHQNRIALIHKPSGKQVIPVVMHPLNGNQITHPILRLLWEVAHQNRHRFLPYQSQILSQSPSCPQLNWGCLCLQSRRWNIKSKIVMDTTGLSKKLDELGVPQYILAGNMDRELLLNRYLPDDLKILIQELNRDNKLTLSEPLWYPSKQFQSETGTSAYPQFVYQFSRPQTVPKISEYFNPITNSQKNCLCFVLTCCGSEVNEVLERLFNRMEEEKILSEVPVWFFLIYGKNSTTEIRLRLLNVTSDQQQILLKKFSWIFSDENWIWKTARYYPETFKYGFKSIEISHRIFHLESMFLTGKSDGEMYLNSSPNWKENTIVKLWLKIITQSPNQFQFFNSLKEDVKGMSKELVIRYKSEFSYLESYDFLPFPTDRYLNLIRSHRLFQSMGKPVIHFLHNHIHMMINRFFPADTANYERRIRYRLYRELGKHLFSRPIPILNSSTEPEFLANTL